MTLLDHGPSSTPDNSKTVLTWVGQGERTRHRGLYRAAEKTSLLGYYIAGAAAGVSTRYDTIVASVRIEDPFLPEKERQDDYESR